MDNKSKRDRAQARWKLLLEVLTRRKSCIDANQELSVRRFSTFNLIKTEFLENDKEDPQHSWFEYRCPHYKNYVAIVRHLDTTFQLEDMMGFNNTGNVCVWPSEEILTFYCLQHGNIFKDKVVCEIGGGMTCLSGIAVATCTEAARVTLTDGNEKSMLNADAIVNRNCDKFGTTKLDTRVLLWDEYEKHTDIQNIYDIIICADCLFFDEYREGLLQTLLWVLKSKGEVIIFAPTRGKSFYDFKELAEPHFTVTCTENYDPLIWSLHQENLDKGIETYDPNLHYPLMMHLQRTS